MGLKDGILKGWIKKIMKDLINLSNLKPILDKRDFFSMRFSEILFLIIRFH